MSQAPRHTALTPLPAASLILLRRAAGLEVLVGRRSLVMRAFPGAMVFPGGKVEPQDGEWPGAAEDVLVKGRYAALRETFEETGLLVAASGEGAPRGIGIAQGRRRVEAGELTFSALLDDWGCVVSPGRLVPFAHWVTPEHASYRFDTLFFLAEASEFEAQAPLICAEFEHLEWTGAARLLEDETARLVTPTRHCLEVLAESSTPAEAIESARERGLIDGYAAQAART